MTADDQRAGWDGQWARKHYKQMIVVRVLLAPWILFVTVFLRVKGYWWGLIFLPFLALDLWLLGASCGTRARKAADVAAARVVDVVIAKPRRTTRHRSGG